MNSLHVREYIYKMKSRIILDFNPIPCGLSQNTVVMGVKNDQPRKNLAREMRQGSSITCFKKRPQIFVVIRLFMTVFFSARI